MLTLESLAGALIDFSDSVMNSFEFMHGALEELYVDLEATTIVQQQLMESIDTLDNMLSVVFVHGVFNTVAIIGILFYLKSFKKSKKSRRK